MDTSYGTSGAAVCTAAASNGRLQEVYVKYYCSLHRRDSVDKKRKMLLVFRTIPVSRIGLSHDSPTNT